MGLKRVHKFILYVTALVILSSSVIIFIPVATHSCCTVEYYYCYPCMITDKLRVTLRLGAVLDTASWLILSVFFFGLVAEVIKINHASNLVELKVRMNN